MPRIPETDIDRVKRSTDLLALVRSRGVELKKHGSKDWIGRCPFHNDQSNPNFIVSPDKGLFHCMVCGKAGNAIQFVQQHDGVSFRHAFEVLAHGQGFTAQPLTREATVPRLPSPLALDADDVALMNQSLAYYRERLAQTPTALEYLQRRGIAAAAEPFGLGFADRTLGLRLPFRNRQDGEALRVRLQKLGLLRESGHEHFNGCIVFPIQNDKSQVTEIYGRKINDNLRPGTAYHLYLPGPHVGIFNRECLASPEIILCEAVIDALTFWVNGFKNVTCIYGTEGFTEELLEALRAHKTRRVYLAYDRDDAGDRAAGRDAEKLQRFGIECLRVKFPHGMDANEYARKVTPPDKSLRLLINAAEWLGQTSSGRNAAAPPPNSCPTFTPPATAPLNGAHVARAPSSSLAAPLVAQPATPATPPAEPAAKKENVPGVAVSENAGSVTLRIAEREWRACGVEHNASFDLLKVNLRLLHTVSERFFLDTFDLCQARPRQSFIKQAAEETGLEPELVQRDLSKVLLELESVRDRRLLGVLQPAKPVPTMTSEEREAALALLRDPRLLDRILADFERCGVVGETTNKLLGYLAAVSRQLDEPLAVIIQSTSAAGKSWLMEAILAFVPEEARVKYSAMTGQSLYYLGDADIRHKVLAVVEEEGAEKASYALKLLQSEGELTIASTGKDPQNGRMVTQEYHVEGPVMILLTTTAIDIDEELLNRCIVLTVDESREQTRRIHELQREARTLDGVRRKLDKAAILAAHRHAQRLLRPLRVVNPYARRLTFLDDRTRTRRDHEKYLTLIEAIAFLHQYQREAQRDSDQLEYIEVTLDDIAVANRLAGEVLGRSLDELPPQTRRLLLLLEEFVKAGCERRKLARADFRFSRRDVREFTGWGNTQLKLHLHRLEEMEYLLPHRGRRGQCFVYELLYEGQGQDGRPFLIGLIDVESLRTAATPAHNYDSNKSGVNADKSAPGRGQVGPKSGGGRANGNATSPNNDGALPVIASLAAQNARPRSAPGAVIS